MFKRLFKKIFYCVTCSIIVSVIFCFIFFLKGSNKTRAVTETQYNNTRLEKKPGNKDNIKDILSNIFYEFEKAVPKYESGDE